jgi:hypothetical protein
MQSVVLQYIYTTGFVRNAANLTHLLQKASKISNMNENFKGIVSRKFAMLLLVPLES